MAMNVKKIETLKSAVFYFTLIYVFSWIAVPIHLQSIDHSSGFESCEVKKDAKHQKHQSKGIAAKFDHPSKHDESHCPICSLALSKVLLDSAKNLAHITTLEWLPILRQKLIPCYSSLIESIRGPPMAVL
jgi:hypothetical protein